VLPQRIGDGGATIAVTVGVGNTITNDDQRTLIEEDATDEAVFTSVEATISIDTGPVESK
jgi:hypothetical protein